MAQPIREVNTTPQVQVAHVKIQVALTQAKLAHIQIQVAHVQHPVIIYASNTWKSSSHTSVKAYIDSAITLHCRLSAATSRCVRDGDGARVFITLTAAAAAAGTGLLEIAATCTGLIITYYRVTVIQAAPTRPIVFHYTHWYLPDGPSNRCIP